jgi:hypothetical protein
MTIAQRVNQFLSRRAPNGFLRRLYRKGAFAEPSPSPARDERFRHDHLSPYRRLMLSWLEAPRVNAAPPT